MKKYLSLLFIILLLNSCAPSREEALDYYEKILTLTHPVESGSIRTVALVVLYTDSNFTEKKIPDETQVREMNAENLAFQKEIETARKQLEELPSLNTGTNIKRVASEYLDEASSIQNIIQNYILKPINDGSYLAKKKI